MATARLTNSERRERMEFHNGIRVWGAEVRFAVRDLLLLGRPYEVQFAAAAIPVRRGVGDPLTDLGLDLSPVMGSRLFQVNRAPSRGFPAYRVVCKHDGSTPADTITTMQADDYLIELNDYDLLLEPMSQSGIRKQLTRAREKQQAITLRLVRLDSLVRVDASRGMTHGHVLNVLAEFEHTHNRLKARYDVLLTRNREVITKRLQRQKKLMGHVRRKSQEMKFAIAQDEHYQQAARIQAWYVQMMEREADVCSAQFDEELPASAERREGFEIAGPPDAAASGEFDDQDMAVDGGMDIDMDDDVGASQLPVVAPLETEYQYNGTTANPSSAIGNLQSGHGNERRGHRSESLIDSEGRLTLGRPAITNAHRILGNASQPTAPRQSLSERLRDIGAVNVDLQWHSVLPKHEMKWLGDSQSTLTKIIGWFVDGFISDGKWQLAMVEVSRAIVTHLVRRYATKLRTQHVTNDAVKKEFMAHARMLQSNICNVGNLQLRKELLEGVLNVELLCGMSSEQLAPQALQEDRQRRAEAYSKEITLRPQATSALVKTRHGYKEVYFDGRSNDTDLSSTIEGDDSTNGGLSSKTMSDGNKTLLTLPTQEVTSAPVTEDVAERFMEVVNIQLSTRKKKAVSFSELLEADLSPGVYSERDQLNRKLAQNESQDRKRQQRDQADFIGSRALVSVLFDPAQDLLEMLRQFQATVSSTPTATMGKEFNLASDVRLFRDSTSMHDRNNTIVYYTRLRLARFKAEGSGYNDRDATVEAVYKLIKEIEEFIRLFGGLLDTLGVEFAIHQENAPRRSRDLAFNYLIERNIASLTDPPPLMIRCENGDFVEEHEISITIDGLVLALNRNASAIQARDGAVQDLMAFLSSVIKRRAETVPSRDLDSGMHTEENKPDLHNHGGNHNSQVHSVPDHSSRWPVRTPYAEETIQASNEVLHGAFRGADHTLLRKRAFDHPPDTLSDEPPVSRRRLGDSPPPQYSPTADHSSNHLNDVQQAVPDTGFYVDAVGEDKPTTKVASTEQKIKANVEAYQDLVKLLFRDQEMVEAKIHEIDWDPCIPESTISLSPRLKLFRHVAQQEDPKLFICKITMLDDMLECKAEHSSREEATRLVMKRMSASLGSIRNDWVTLVGEYGTILERKKHQRGKVADPTLSAANETRQSKKVNTWVRDEERSVGHLAEYVVRVHHFYAIRHACLNMKMAKRAATEECRDLLEILSKMEKSEATRTTSSTGGTTSLPPRRQTQTAAKPRRISNMVQCSDDSDDDDDDDEYDSGGGGYSDDEGDWAPPVKQNNEVPAVPVDKRVVAPNRVNEELDVAYSIESEKEPADDAKTRAIIRSLFTPDDALCEAISGLRGSLKFVGSYNTVEIVQNVKASIRFDRLPGGIFDVHTNVNDVVYVKSTANSKKEACRVAIEGLLIKLKAIRSTWAQLLHFMHIKYIGTANLMDTFNLLRLANITDITAAIEPPPTKQGYTRQVAAKMSRKVHCAIRIGEYVVYRVNEDTEDDAKAIANCRIAKFIVNLIDSDLDPEPIEDSDVDMTTTPSTNAMPVTQSRDWACIIRIQDFGDRESHHEFHVDGTWCMRDRIPPSTNFPASAINMYVTQLKRVPMTVVEKMLEGVHDSILLYFRLDSAYEHGKFVNRVAEYGNKNRTRAFVLMFDISPATDYKLFVLPPGASVNSEDNLYWPRRVIPRELSDRKAVYGYLIHTDDVVKYVDERRMT